MVHFSTYLQAHRRDAWASHYVKWVDGQGCISPKWHDGVTGIALIHASPPCSYSELKQLLYQTLKAPHAVYVPTKLSLSSGTGTTAAAAHAAAAAAGGVGSLTTRVTPGHMSLRMGASADTTAQEQFFRALEHEVARIDDFAQVRGCLPGAQGGH